MCSNFSIKMLAVHKILIFIITLISITLLIMLIFSPSLPAVNPFKLLTCSNISRTKFRSEKIQEVSLQSNLEFMRAFDKFEWENFTLALNKQNQEEISKYITDLILRITPYLTLEPPVPVNESCTTPPLRAKEQIKCKNGSSPYPKKIGFLLQLGFEVDTLEIHLNELFDVVDKFFIIESTRTHSKFYRKPLIWEQIKYQTRFQKFQSKIVHFVVDDSSSVTSMKRTINASALNSFASEDLQEKLRWKKFLRWNKATKFFNATDLLGFGDCDEIANRETVNYLKYCVPESDPIDVGIWFPFGAIDQAFISDYPVQEHPFTLGDPTFWTLKSAMDIKTIAFFNLPGFPTRNRGRSTGHILGGMHMTHYGYLPALLMKRLTQSESSYDSLKEVALLPQYSYNKSLEELQKFYSEDYYKSVKFRIFKLDKIKPIDPEKEHFVILPWYYNCNRPRYPAWEKKPDTRLYKPKNLQII